LKDEEGEVINTIQYENGNNNGIEVALYGQKKSNTITFTSVGQSQIVNVYYGDKEKFFYVLVKEIQVENISIFSLQTNESDLSLYPKFSY